MEGEEEEGGGVSEEVRRVWLWVHPAAAKEALREIRKACSLEGAPWVGNIEVRAYSTVQGRGRQARCFFSVVFESAAGGGAASVLVVVGILGEES